VIFVQQQHQPSGQPEEMSGLTIVAEPTSATTVTRDGLLAGIAARRELFEAAGREAEQFRTLPAGAVQELRALGLFWLKTPAELGGTPLPPLEFCDVIEELAYADTSSAWAAIIGAGCNGLAGGWLPEAGAARVFGPGRPLPVVAGQMNPRGTGRPVDGGYRVSGHWGFASGVQHASWLIGEFTPAQEPAGPIVVFALPRDQAEVIDNWHVAGLQGTGSMDFRLEDAFVPAEMTFGLGAAAVRGGDLFRLGIRAFVSNEVPPLCIGMARRALDDMTGLAAGTARLPGGPALSERAVFHKELGRAEVALRAARLVHRDAVDACWQAARAGHAPSPDQELAVATASVFAVETCVQVISDLFRYGGGRVLSLASPLQLHLRNALAARQHVLVSEEFYEIAGHARLAARPA
jgi:alkylation response protein AidB-like acyl-CoA dehydrogenase